MAKYVCGPSVLRLDGKIDQPIQPGETFEAELPPEQEAVLLVCGALTIAVPVGQNVKNKPAPPAVVDTPMTEKVS